MVGGSWDQCAACSAAGPLASQPARWQPGSGGLLAGRGCGEQPAPPVHVLVLLQALRRRSCARQRLQLGQQHLRGERRQAARQASGRAGSAGQPRKVLPRGVAGWATVALQHTLWPANGDIRWVLQEHLCSLCGAGSGVQSTASEASTEGSASALAQRARTTPHGSGNQAVTTHATLIRGLGPHLYRQVGQRPGNVARRAKVDARVLLQWVARAPAAGLARGQ